VVAEAMGGLRHLTAEPGRVPVRVGVSIGDTLASLHGVIGILMALHHRNSHGVGQVIDVALYEAVFNCMESLLPEYDAFGAMRGPAGSALPGIAPTNAYRCKDGAAASAGPPQARPAPLGGGDDTPVTSVGAYVLIAGNGDSIYRRLMKAIGRDDLGSDPALGDNAGRVLRVAEIDAAIGQWTAQRSVAEVLAVLDEASVPAGKIYSIADIAADPHYQARGMLAATRMDDGSSLMLPGIIPKLSLTPGGHRRNAPALGQDTDAVLQELGLSPEQIQGLKDKGIIASNPSGAQA
jgi:formyl-CoA transferase